jgi:hypothetical protein
MVIQRIQSLYLLLAAIAMGIYAFFPSLIDANGKSFFGGYKLGVELVPFILNCLVALLAFIAIFKFKRMRLQKTLCIVNIVLIISSLATVCVFALLLKDCDLLGSLSYYNLLPVVAIIFLLLAHKAISHDQKLLRGSSRIR